MDIRTQRIVYELLGHPESTINELMLELSLSKRQVEYSLTKLNQLFAEKSVPQVNFMKRSALQLSTEQIQVIQEEQRKERKLVATLDAQYRSVLLLIFVASSSEFVSLAHIMQLFSISKNTAIADFKRSEAQAEEYAVKIAYNRARGYHLAGDEWKKRSLLIKCISLFTEWAGYEQIYGYLLSKLGINTQVNVFIAACLESVHQSQIRFIEKRLHEILLFIFIRWQMTPISEDLLKPYADQLLDPDTQCMEIASLFVKKLRCTVVDSEIRYCAVLLQSIKIDTNLSYESPLDKILKKIVEDMVDRFERISGNLICNKQQLADNLFLHLKPVYYRLHYDIPIINPLLSQMKEEYKEFFEIVRILLKPLENLVQKKIPEDEIGYITMHLGLIATDEINILSVARKNGIILCPNGIGTSALVEKQLQELFPEINFFRASSASELDQLEETIKKVDVVFSTTDISAYYRGSVPVFVVPVLLSNAKKYQLSNQVYERIFGFARKDADLTSIMELIAKYADIRDSEGLKHSLKNKMVSFSGIKETSNKGDGCKVLKDLLTNETVQFSQSAPSWEAAIELAMRPLLGNGSIEQRYIDAIIETVKTVGPYIVIAPMVCIPHANCDQGVLKLGMTFLKLEEPVKVLCDEDKQAKIFFGLAATDNHSHLKALSQLSQMLMDESTLERLMTIADKAEFLAIVEAFSNQNE